MKRYLFLLIWVIARSVFSQTIPNEKFSWEIMAGCGDDLSSEIFIKVEKDPVLLGISKDEFLELVRKMVLNLNLENDQSGTLKLKLLFTKEQYLCLRAMGHIEFALNSIQKDKLFLGFSSIGKIKPGEQRNAIVHCQGILYLILVNGKLSSLQNVNFTFDE